MMLGPILTPVALLELGPFLVLVLALLLLAVAVGWAKGRPKTDPDGSFQ